MKKIEEFVTEYYSKEKSRYESRRNLQNYFKIIDADQNTYFRKKKKPDYEKDILTYFKTIADLSPPTRHSYISFIKVYLEENDVLLRPSIWKKIKRLGEGTKPRTIDRCPTNKEMRQILTHAGAVEKALFLVISSSGMRIGETLKLNPSNINMNSNPVQIDLPGSITKNGNPRTTFMSNEGRDALIEWLKVREEYLIASISKSVSLGIDRIDDLESKRIFPFSYSTGRKMWIRLLKKSGLDDRDENTKVMFHKLHEHVLRKFFETNMTTSGVPEAAIQRLTGHEGYLNGVYKKFPVQDLADFYKKGVDRLLVFETSEDSKRLSTIEQQLEQRGTENSMLRKDLDILKNEMRQQQKLLIELIAKNKEKQ